MWSHGLTAHNAVDLAQHLSKHHWNNSLHTQNAGTQTSGNYTEYLRVFYSFSTSISELHNRERCKIVLYGYFMLLHKIKIYPLCDSQGHSALVYSNL